MNNVICQIEKIPENFNEARYLPVLNREEILRYKGFSDVSRKRQFLFSRFILKNKLFEITGQNADEIHFELSAYGKPFLPNNRIHFNISHSENYVAYVISKKEVGIDIQAQREFSNFNGLVKKICHPNEVTMLDNSSDKARQLLKIWSLKEAYSKCLALGLQTNFSSLDFSDLAIKNFEDETFAINNIDFEVSFKVLARTQKLFVSIFKELGASLPKI